MSGLAALMQAAMKGGTGGETMFGGAARKSGHNNLFDGLAMRAQERGDMGMASRLGNMSAGIGAPAVPEEEEEEIIPEEAGLQGLTQPVYGTWGMRNNI